MSLFATFNALLAYNLYSLIKHKFFKMPKPRRKKVFVVYMTISGDDIEIFNAPTQSKCKEFAEKYQQNNPNVNLTVSPSPVFL